MSNTDKLTTIKNLIVENMRSGRFMTVDFIKKTTGELRHMQVRKSKVLEASVKGTAPDATAARKATNKVRNLLLVEELVRPATNEFQWRTINLEGVRKISCNGRVYNFD